MNTIHEGYVLEGYYAYSEGYGVFLKDSNSHKRIIYKLVVKESVIDAAFENSIIHKNILRELPQVVMEMDPIPATKASDIESRRLIYVVHVNYFLAPTRFLLFKVIIALLYLLF